MLVRQAMGWLRSALFLSEIMRDAQYWIDRLNLTPHPEGGYFREVYRSAEEIPATALPVRFGGERAFSTAIYFLLRSGETSAFHRISQDELWHFYAGCPLILHCITPDGEYAAHWLGLDGEAAPLVIIPAGVWFGAVCSEENSYTLAGCTVAPGFDFADFEMGTRTGLISRYPQHEDIIRALTHP